MRFRVQVPFLIGARDEFALRVPARHVGAAIVQAEEHKPFGLGTLVGGDRMPRAPVFHLVFEKVAVKNTAIDQRHGSLFIVFVAIFADQMPSATGDVLVDTRDGRLPVFFTVDGPLNTFPALEPIEGAESHAQTEKEVGRHDGSDGEKRKDKHA